MSWDAVLDDLDARVTAAERGDLDALAGWTRPDAQTTPMVPAQVARAAAIAARQQSLAVHLTQQRDAAAASLAGLRGRRTYRATGPVPVYVDRLA